LILSTLEFSTAILDVFLVGFNVFLRVGTALTLMPAFGESVLPARIKITLGIFLSIIIAPMTGEAVSPSEPSIGPMLSEIVVGFGIGLSVRIYVLALTIVGTILGQVGSMAQLFGAGNADPQPAIGLLLTYAGIAIFTGLNLHVLALEFLVRTYEIMPIGFSPFDVGFLSRSIELIGIATYQAILLSSPFLLCSLIYNLLSGLINKSMPQLSLNFMATPALMVSVLLSLMFLAEKILTKWADSVEIFLTSGP
jgi:flagellar biosynthesis protein FliR